MSKPAWRVYTPVAARTTQKPLYLQAKTAANTDWRYI
ncbi:hypothetical protein CJA_2464 [Cellvibrio japonicus Ueda107]|uniref:Uncharacterized protein n=1 Tax=Cellvibrio japonicus (strain Ueda107) TaxID=498211 RepID=B3PKJ6_CELJU|nr:hypothetical protein CJA_2464 [Cellvibrio japonicus Ueda107]